MFYWNSSLYMDEQVQKNPKKYRRYLERKKIAKQCYCITLPVNGENCMDIYCSRELWFSYCRRCDMEIIGIAADKEGIQKVLCDIVKDIVAKYGTVNSEMVKKFFSKT